MITLATMQPEEGACFYPWIADPDVIRYSLSAFQAMKTPAQIDDWFAATLRDEKSLNLGIYLQGTHALIGYAGLSNLSATNQSGEYFILIGEKAHCGKGQGKCIKTVDLAFPASEGTNAARFVRGNSGFSGANMPPEFGIKGLVF